MSNSKSAVTLVGRLPPFTLEALNALYEVNLITTPEERAANLPKIADSTRVLITNGTTGADAGLIAALPKLELIACFGVGTDAVDHVASKARGITVTNTPDVLNDDVADLAIGLMLAGARRIVEGDRYVRAGKWLKGQLPLATKVTGKTLGILGMGRIGQAIAERAAGFRMEILYNSRTAKPALPYRFVPDLAEMAKLSDILIAICPGGPETHHIVNQKVIEALGPKGLLVNVARGSVVDEPALVAALADGRLGGAALDVFEDEPRVPEALFAMDHVVLQPHVGSGTADTRRAMGQLMMDNVAAYFAGRPLLTPC